MMFAALCLSCVRVLAKSFAAGNSLSSVICYFNAFILCNTFASFSV